MVRVYIYVYIIMQTHIHIVLNWVLETSFWTQATRLLFIILHITLQLTLPQYHPFVGSWEKKSLRDPSFLSWQIRKLYLMPSSWPDFNHQWKKTHPFPVELSWHSLDYFGLQLIAGNSFHIFKATNYPVRSMFQTTHRFKYRGSSQCILCWWSQNTGTFVALATDFLEGCFCREKKTLLWNGVLMVI